MVDKAVSARSLLWVGLVAMTCLLFAVGAVVWFQQASDSSYAPAEDVPATANQATPTRAQNSPMLAVDPTHPEFVALAHRQDAPDFDCGLQISGTGGRGWVGAEPVPQLPEGAEKCYAPQVAFDDEGTLYYLFVGLHGEGNVPMGVFLTTSSDRGRSFEPPREILGAHNFQVRLAIDRTVGGEGRLHLVWLSVREEPPLGGLPPGPNPILHAYSEDGGRSFSEPVQVNDASRDRAVAPALTVGEDDRVHVLYYDLKEDARDYQGLEGPVWEGTWSLVATTQNRNGGFSEGVVVDDGLVPPERVMLIFTMPPPAVTADGAGNVYAGWHDGRNGAWDVFVARSEDGARSWGEPVGLGDDESGDGSNQYLPQLETAPEGRLHAIYYDRRNDPENVRNDVYYTVSENRGRTFGEDFKLTSKMSDSRSGAEYAVPSASGQVEFGSRLALQSQSGELIAAWTDTRNAPSSRYQDVFTAKVSTPRGLSTWLKDALIALVIGGGVAVAVSLGLLVRAGWRQR